MQITTAFTTKRDAWRLAARPKTLPASIVGPIVGSALALADHHFAPAAALAAIVVALLLQIAANFANDVFDFHRGADTTARLGPPRVTQAGLLSPSAVLAGTAIVIGLAIVCGLYLVWRGGWPILVLGLLAILAALAYTGGPFPIGYHGLGEVFVFLFFGLAGVTGTYYVQAQRVSSLAWLSAIPIGLLAAAILVVNNLRDLATDRAVGKHTLAVRLGRTGTLIEYALLVLISYLILPLLWLTGHVSGWWWLPWLSLPWAVLLIRRLGQTTGRAMNPLLAATAKLLLLYGLLFAGSVLL